MQDTTIDWRRGMYLTERVASHEARDNHDAVWVNPLVELWRGEAGLHADDDFIRRLAADHLDLVSFRSLVAGMDRPQGANDPEKPSWAITLDAVFTAAVAATAAERQHVFTFLRQVPFGLPLWPLVYWAWDIYRDRIAAPQWRAVVATPDTIVGPFLEGLTEQLANCALRVMALKINIARLRGELTEASPAERFSAFVSRYADLGSIRELLAQYPVLARLLVTKATAWVDATLEAFTRCHTDIAELGMFTGTALGTIASIRSTGSDPHRHGRRAFVFSFDGDTKLLYKPRSLAADEHFQEYVAWANAQGITPELPVLRVLDRGDYGWQEFIEGRPCSSREQVRLFYRRQGVYLALLYTLGATDFHRENLIASGQYPYLVDLETLFHCHDGPREDESATYRAYRTTKDSVLATGLLPFFVSDAEGESATDISGLGGAGGQASLTEVLQWTGVGTDQISAHRTHSEMGGENNRPTLDGVAVATEDFANEVLAGFEDAYDLLAKRRAAVAAQLRLFSDVRVRYVVRPTFLYGLAREAGYHPDYLGNGLHRDRLMDRFWAGLPAFPGVEPIIQAERADLLDDDVPYFFTRPDSSDLWDSRGEILPGYFGDVTGLSIALARVARMGAKDRHKQSEFIKVSLGCGGRTHLELRQLDHPHGTDINSEAFLAAAVSVGQRLLDTAICGSTTTSATWLEPRWMGKDRWQLGPADLGLYNGLPGIAYFLGYLGTVTGDERFKQATDAAVASIDEMLASPIGLPNASAFLGRGSVIYLFTHLASIRNDPRFLDRAIEQAERFSTVGPDTEADILDGAAGTVLVLLGLYEATRNPRVLEIAACYGDHIVQRAEPMPVGLGWRSAITPRPLAGLSHGVAGIAWALAALGRATDDDQYRSIALEGIRYERTLFDLRRGNWLDLRKPDLPGAMLPSSWCHGAPGIAIARLLTANLLHDEEIPEEIDVALATTLREGFQQSDCLCHGDFGNLEALLLAADRPGHNSLRRIAYERARESYRSAYCRGRWLSGWGTNRDEAAGLMTGLAGTGFALLRLATDLQIPTPVCLAPPMPHGTASLHIAVAAGGVTGAR